MLTYDQWQKHDFHFDHVNLNRFTCLQVLGMPDPLYPPTQDQLDSYVNQRERADAADTPSSPGAGGAGGDSGTSGHNGGTDTSAAGDGGLGTGAIVAIVVCVAVALLVLAAIAAFFVLRKRRTGKAGSESSSDVAQGLHKESKRVRSLLRQICCRAHATKCPCKPLLNMSMTAFEQSRSCCAFQFSSACAATPMHCVREHKQKHAEALCCAGGQSAAAGWAQ